jgi:RHS repeat-associated protein
MVATNYVWDGQQYLMETDDSNTVQAVWMNEPDQYTNLISQRRSAATQYPHFDAMGSTRHLTDVGENVTDAWIYDAWGNVVSRVGVAVFPLQFVGRFGYYYDPDTNTFYIIRRILEPENGRWWSIDPWWISSWANTFIYARNNLLIIIDPSGLYPEMMEFCSHEECEKCIENAKKNHSTTIPLLKVIKERECPEHEIKCCGESTRLSESPCNRCGEGRVRVGNVEQVTRPLGGIIFEKGKFVV